MIEMHVDALLLDSDSEEPVYALSLVDADGGTTLTIEIGAMEGMTLSFVLNKEKLPRPLTHDLLLLCLKALQCQLVSAELTAFRDGMYYAAIELHQGRKRIRIDCRPADAITLAVRASKPIFVKDSLLTPPDEPKDAIPYQRTPDSAADMARTASANHLLDIMSVTRHAGDGGDIMREARLQDGLENERLMELLKSLEPETRRKM